MTMIKLAVWRAGIKPKGLPNGPATLNAILNALVRNIPLFSPRSERFRLSVVRQVAVAAGVVGLLFCVSPPAISGLVVSVVVWEAVNAHSDRAFPHIGEKITEILPPITNRNSPASIARVLVVGRALASRSDVAPNVVCPCARHSMRDRLGCKDVCFVAPARFGVSTYQGASVDGDYITAIAGTLPSRPSAFGICLAAAKNNKATEAFICVIDKRWHFVIPEIAHHGGARHPVMRPEFGSYPSRAKGTIA